jgi:hypothetical protein
VFCYSQLSKSFCLPTLSPKKTAFNAIVNLLAGKSTHVIKLFWAVILSQAIQVCKKRFLPVFQYSWMWPVYDVALRFGFINGLLVLFLVLWHTCSISLRLCDVINSHLACLQDDIIFSISAGVSNQSSYKHCIFIGRIYFLKSAVVLSVTVAKLSLAFVPWATRQ